MTLTDKYLAQIDRVITHPFPDNVIKKAYNALLDYICVTVAGAYKNKECLEQYCNNCIPEHGKSTVIGTGMKLTLKDAVFFNGLNSHILDLDDGTNIGIIHLGAPIFSTLIPIAEKYSISLKKMLYAAIIGYETSFTMAASIQPKHKAIGYHATGTCGILGVTMAISYMLDYSNSERKNAFSVAAISAGGMLKVIDDESELKSYNVAKCALLGLISAQIAKTGGVEGNRDPLGGDRGYIKMMTGCESIRFVPPILNGTYAIEKVYTKVYAACRYCHPSIEAAIKLRNDVDIFNIRMIRVKTYDLAIHGHNHNHICGINSAKMSIPYGVAVGIIHGRAGLEEYDENHITNKVILNLAKKVMVESDPGLSKSFPEKQIAIVEIELKNNKVLFEKIEYPKGEPENPLSWGEFRKRFISILKFANVNSDRAKQIINLCKTENLCIDELCTLL